MNRSHVEDAMAELEPLVDHHGLHCFLTALAEICYGKAEHLASNWQDQAAARAWTRAAERIGKANLQIDVG